MTAAAAIPQLAPHFWVTQSALFQTNSGIWIAGDAAYLVDPGIAPAEVAGIARFVASQGATVHTIILTHGHWDHILGPEHFPGARVVAQAEYLVGVREHGAGILREIDDWAAKQPIPRTQPFVIPVATATFAQATTVAVGALTLHLTHAPGHCPDQLIVYEPASGTLWAADMLSDREIPFVSHNLAAYRRTLAALAGYRICLLVPGHGASTADAAEIAARLAADRAYLAQLHAAVTAALAGGRTVAETVAACAGLLYRHPDTNAEPHRWNVESAYLELGGAGDPQTLGWGRAK